MTGHLSQNLAVYSGLVGSALPLAIAAIQRGHWSSRVRSAVAFAACLAAGAGTAALDGDFTAKGTVGAVLIVFTLARASYAALWRPTGVAPKLEEATTPKPAAPPRTHADLASDIAAERAYADEVDLDAPTDDPLAAAAEMSAALATVAGVQAEQEVSP